MNCKVIKGYFIHCLPTNLPPQIMNLSQMSKDHILDLLSLKKICHFSQFGEK